MHVHYVLSENVLLLDELSIAHNISDRPLVNEHCIVMTRQSRKQVICKKRIDAVVETVRGMTNKNRSKQHSKM